MGDLSAIFHFFSLIVLLSLMILVSRLHARLKLWRDWCSVGAGDRVLVGEPIRVIARFADAIGCTFENSVPSGAMPARKLKLVYFFEVHRKYGIAHIKLSDELSDQDPSGKTPQLSFLLNLEPATMGKVTSFELDQYFKDIENDFKVRVVCKFK